VAVFGLASDAYLTPRTPPPGRDAIAAVGAIVFAANGHVDLQVGLLLIAGGLAGALVGARIMARMPEALLRRAFGILMLAVGIRLLLP
jgi:uncharacterized membrane protein YfcA